MPSQRFAALIFAATALCAFLALTVATPTAAQTPTPTPTATAVAFAPCPSGVTIAVTPPVAAAPTTVSVTVTPAINIKAGSVGDVNSFHLHYFIDTAPAAAGTVIPSGDPKIIHSGATTQDLGTLADGQHTVTVVLGQLNHTACDARGAVTFSVTQAPSSAAAPKTGNAGLLAPSRSTASVALLLGAMALLTIIGRLGTARRN